MASCFVNFQPEVDALIHRMRKLHRDKTDLEEEARSLAAERENKRHEIIGLILRHVTPDRQSVLDLRVVILQTI